MSGPSIPSGPSPEEIARQEREQERRVRFETERADYLGKVGAYEIASTTMKQRRANSLEYGGGPAEPPVESLFVPARFEPTMSDIPLEELVTYEWWQAENLGIDTLGIEDMTTKQRNAFVKEAEFNRKYYEALQNFDNWKGIVPERYNRRNPMPEGTEPITPYLGQTRSNAQIATGDFLKPVGGGYYDRLIRAYVTRGNTWSR